MEIIPAIDIKDGKCVRLYQGDFDKLTVYSENPLGIARKFQVFGAKRLHIIDLDGAQRGTPVNFDYVQDIVDEVNIPIQFGGGLRNIKDIEKVFQSSVNRIILGSVIFSKKDMEPIAELVKINPERFVGALDVKNGIVAIHGWQELSGKSILEVGEYLIQLGFKRILVTDISTDGTLQGPNFSLYEELVKKLPLKVIASGGVGNYGDLKKLEQTGVESVVVGKAIYTQDLDLRMLFA